jgi:hypothetical protein
VPHGSRPAGIRRLWKGFMNCASSSQKYTSHIKAAVFCVPVILITYIRNHFHSQPLSFTTTSSLNRSHSFLLFAWCSSPLSLYSHTPIHALSLRIRSPGRDFDSICKSFCLKRPPRKPSSSSITNPSITTILVVPCSSASKHTRNQSASDKPR